MRSLRSSESPTRTIAPQEQVVVELDPQYAAYTFPRRPSHASSNDSSRRPSTLNIPHPGNYHNISNSRRPSTSSPSSASILSTSSMLPDDKLKTCPYLIGGKQNYDSQPLYNTTTRRRPSIVPSMASTTSVDSITSIPPVLLNTPMSPDTGVPPPSSPTSSVNQESHQFSDVMNRRTLSSIPNRQSSRPVGEGPGVFQGTSKEDYDTEILGAHDAAFSVGEPSTEKCGFEAIAFETWVG
ncbi:hypothetical protein BDR26DRAFT_853804 [Obelidium mucronatum]|nr:hypothetical protein BDR26DRAFT_853804 [Obelidium mucronatum]